MNYYVHWRGLGNGTRGKTLCKNCWSEDTAFTYFREKFPYLAIVDIKEETR